MPRLLLLNGPPGVGKSTLAQMYAADHPLTLNLDLDVVRALLGGWSDQPDASGRLARDLAASMVDTHLAAGHDVAVPQYLGRHQFVERLEALAAARGAHVDEVAVMAEKGAAVRRFQERHREATAREHEDQASRDVVQRAVTADVLEAMWDRLAALLRERPCVRIVWSVPDDPVLTYRRLLAVLQGGDGGA